MTDKEVGEWWKLCGHEDITHDTMNDNLFTIKCLIRKLVEERENSFEGDYDALDHALDDFGIDPETFK